MSTKTVRVKCLDGAIAVKQRKLVVSLGWEDSVFVKFSNSHATLGTVSRTPSCQLTVNTPAAGTCQAHHMEECL